MDHAVMKMTKEGVGSYLTDAKMMTLYWFKKDSPGKSACAGPCVEKWPIYYRETVAAGEGVKAEISERSRARTGRSRRRSAGTRSTTGRETRPRETPKGREWATSGM